MLKIDFDKTNGSLSKVLCLGAHADDIEIGCGGTILKLAENLKNIMFYWVVFSSNELRYQEALKSAKSFLKGSNIANIVIKNFRDGFFPFLGMEIKEYFEDLKKDFSPDIIFTHYRNDLHQDHRLISELTWNTFRNNLILEYEIPKYDGDIGCPNFFVHLDDDICNRKAKYIFENFESQREKQWFRKETFFSILTLRGIESSSPTKYAEAFYCRKIIY
jgi:LmbE family N-acetylglucosaminyl deacetylase